MEMEKIMRIGLVRHFGVDCVHKTLMSPVDFREWAKLYDCSPIKIGNKLINQYTWSKCYCSDLPRTVATAQHIYDGNILKSELLREVPIAPIFEYNVKFPYIFWTISGRLAWHFSHQSQPETISQTKDRVGRFTSSIIEEDNVLIVTHGFLMVLIQKELIDRGFLGDTFKMAKHGKVYVFEKDK